MHNNGIMITAVLLAVLVLAAVVVAISLARDSGSTRRARRQHQETIDKRIDCEQWATHKISYNPKP